MGITKSHAMGTEFICQVLDVCMQVWRAHAQAHTTLAKALTGPHGTMTWPSTIYSSPSGSEALLLDRYFVGRCGRWAGEATSTSSSVAVPTRMLSTITQWDNVVTMLVATEEVGCPHQNMWAY